MQLSLKEFVSHPVFPTSINEKNKIGAPLTLVSDKTGTALSGLVNTIPLPSKPWMSKNLQGLYVIRDKSTGKFYIGSTSCMTKRKSLHMNRIIQGIHFNPSIADAFNETNVSSFEFQYFIADSGTDVKVVRGILLDFEQELLDQYGGTEVCWNVSKDTRATGKGLDVRESTRELISQALTGIKRSDETREKMKEAKKDWVPPEHVMEKAHRVTERAVYVKGKAYRSTVEAAKAEGVSEMTAYRKLNHPKYKSPDWQYVDEMFSV